MPPGCRYRLRYSSSTRTAMGEVCRQKLETQWDLSGEVLLSDLRAAQSSKKESHFTPTCWTTAMCSVPHSAIPTVSTAWGAVPRAATCDRELCSVGEMRSRLPRSKTGNPLRWDPGREKIPVWGHHPDACSAQARLRAGRRAWALSLCSDSGKGL